MKLGDCYEVAAKTILDLQDATLVHAMVNGQGPLEGTRFGHAWLEVYDWVLDLSNGHKVIVSKELYYEVAEPEPIVRYSWEEAAKLMLSHGHYGPWDPVFGAT